jgi:hypothetical protein
MNYFRCNRCGRFISYADLREKRVVEYVPYGSYYDYEPPDGEYIHENCWWKMSEEYRDLTVRVSWLPPANRFMTDNQREILRRRYD